MKLALLAILVISLGAYASSYPVSSNQCCSKTSNNCCNGSGRNRCTGTSNCCSETSTNCCSETSTNCCSQTNGSCCSEKSRNCCNETVRNCCREESRCCNGNGRDCSCDGGNNCCCDDKRKCSCVDDDDKDKIEIDESTEKVCIKTSKNTTGNLNCATSPSGCALSTNITNVNNNNSTVIVPTNITVETTIHSETRVFIPINVSVVNENNINIEPAVTGAPTGPVQNCTNPPQEGCRNHTEVVTVKVPIHIPVPVPYIVTIPEIIQVPVGCCQVVVPCTPYIYGGCHTSNTECGSCSGNIVYEPRNVCGMGCHKREIGIGTQCQSGGCSSGQINCSMCNRDFYHTYENFMMCSGCFVPMPWGMGRY